jgi:hypothetical protein
MTLAYMRDLHFAILRYHDQLFPSMRDVSVAIPCFILLALRFTPNEQDIS